MKLISAKIENFGKLRDRSIDFSEGLNVFLRENGFGKTTLASFIRVMFYGLSGDRKSQDEDNDRKKFRPWQGGTFGGELVFELSEGRSYRIVRTFGERKAQDTFTLYDAETNLPSTDFSENIGEEILKIDERSFRRTVFIGQQELETGMTSQINAKIGNVSEDPEDMNRYETVMESIKDEVNNLSPNRRTGAIFKKRMELEILQSEFKNKEALEKELTGSAERLKNLGDEQRTRAKNIEILNSRAMALSQYQDTLKDKMKYEDLIEDISECEKRLMEIQRRHFGAEADTLTPEERSSRLNHDMRELDVRFRNGVPGETELRGIEKRISRIQFLHEKLDLMEQAGLRARGKGYGGEISNLTGIMVYILSVILIIIGAYMIFTDLSLVIGACILAAGLSMLIIMLISQAVSGNSGHKSSGGKERHRQTIDEVYEEIDKLTSEVVMYLKRYYPKADFSDPDNVDFEAFGSLGNDILRYSRLCDLKGFAEELALKRREKAEFEQTHDIEKLRNAMRPGEDGESFETLSRKLQETTEEYNEAVETINRLKLHSQNIEKELEKVYEKERQYVLGLDELRELEQRYNLLILTRDHIEEAHNNFTKEYMAPLMSAFEKFYRILINTNGLREIPYRMDAHFNVNFIADGREHSTQLLSAGFRNMVELARRMAFIEAMYQKEKPFILLDDPFVNLDDYKIPGAMQFLDEIARSYQVIYFTCHESRQ